MKLSHPLFHLMMPLSRPQLKLSHLLAWAILLCLRGSAGPRQPPLRLQASVLMDYKLPCQSQAPALTLQLCWRCASEFGS